MMLPKTVDDDPGQQVAGTVVHVGNPVRQGDTRRRLSRVLRVAIA